MKITACMAFLFAMLSSAVFSQTADGDGKIDITGVVHSVTDSTVLNSVSIMVKGTSKGTTTNMAGTYLITAGRKDVLVFSLVGHVTQEVPVNGRTSIDIYMQVGDMNQLSEVV